MLGPRETVIYDWGMFALITLFVGFRFWTTLTRGRRKFKLSDWATLIAWTLVLGATCSGMQVSLMEYRGEQRATTEFVRKLPQLALTETEITLYWKLTLSVALIAYAGLWAIKATFCAIYWEFSDGFGRGLKIWLVIVTGYVFLTFAVAFLSLILECRPISRVWLPLISQDFCHFYDHRSLIIYFSASTSADVAIMAFPLFLIKTLKMNRRLIKSMVFVMAVGCISIAASIARFIVLMQLLSNELDVEKNSTLAVLWGFIEMNFGILASCLPVFRVYIRGPPKVSRNWTHPFTPKRIRSPLTIGFSTMSSGLSTSKQPGGVKTSSVAREEPLPEEISAGVQPDVERAAHIPEDRPMGEV